MKTMIIAGVLALSLAGCGNRDSAPTTQQTATTANPVHPRYAVELGSFRDDAAAQAWVSKLKAVGVPAYVETVTKSDGTTATALRGGPFDSSADASAALAKIRQKGLMAADEVPASAPAAAPAPASPVAAASAPAAPVDAARQKQCEDVRTIAQLYGDELVRGHDRKELLRKYGGTNDDIALINSVDQRMSDGTTTVQQAMDAAYDDCMSAASAPVLSGMEPEQTFDDKVHQYVRPHIEWDGPTSDLATVIAVHCSPNGVILSAMVKSSSGNPQWDAAALKAVQQTDPMPLDADGHAPASFEITMRPAG